MASSPSCFLPISPDSPFSIHNLPYGVFRPSSSLPPRPGVAIGDHVLDLSALARAGLFQAPLLDCFLQSTLNSFMALGRPVWKEARATIQKILSAEEPTLRDDPVLKGKALIPMNQVTMELPAVIGDYTDFSSSEHHIRNCFKIFQGQDDVPPNWLHLPVGTHGTASSVVISGTDIIRPRAQAGPPPEGKSLPVFGPSAHLDYELEMALFVGPGNDLGCPVNIDTAYDHIFGLVLMNNWSARDIQFWDSTSGKSFATTISPWIVTLEALEPFICEAPKQNPHLLPYLKEPKRITYDIPIEVAIRPKGQERASVVCQSNFKHLYWTIAQQLAHYTINGCNLRTGDLLATGTISGPEPGSLGCLLELTMFGTKEVELKYGGTRKFLEDGDEVILTGCCQGNGFSVGFGTCSGKVLPAKS